MSLNVIDPDGVRDDRTASLVHRPDGSWSLGPPDRVPDDGEEREYIGPGWVDLHCHVFDGMTSISVDADRVGRDAGVHLLADAGSAGQATIDGFARYVRPRAGTAITSWINIGSHGLVHLREVAHAEYLDVDATLAAIDRHRDFVCGVKVRSSGAIVGEMGTQPLKLARLVARTSGLPLMVHIGEAPPVIEDVLDLLEEGDVITHCFHGKSGAPWHPDGSPVPALRRALDRGVVCDVGHGAASFRFPVARAAIAAGFSPHTVSTDIHVRNIGGPVHDLATVMSKMLACGMPLGGVVAAVTSSPRRILRRPEPWLGDDGAIRHATVFRLARAAPAGRTYLDSAGEAFPPQLHIVPTATIRDGELRPCP